MQNKRLDIEFKTTVIRFFKNFLEKAHKFSETLEDMKKDQLEIKHTLTEKKNYTETKQQTRGTQESSQRFVIQRGKGHFPGEARREENSVS